MDRGIIDGCGEVAGIGYSNKAPEKSNYPNLSEFAKFAQEYDIQKRRNVVLEREIGNLWTRILNQESLIKAYEHRLNE